MPFTRTPHTNLPCSSPEVAAWAQWPTVWEIWCMEGGVEQRMAGAWPEPPPIVPWPESYNTGPHKATAKRAAPSTVALKFGGTMTANAPAVEVAPVATPELCDAMPIPDLAPGRCGWYRVSAGDIYHERIYTDFNSIDAYKQVTPGAWHLTYGMLITHAIALPCDDPRIVDAINGGRYKNVYCTIGDRLLRFNGDDVIMQPLVLLGDYDRMVEGQ